MKTESLKNIIGVTIFYLIIVFGVVALNARMEYINKHYDISQFN